MAVNAEGFPIPDYDRLRATEILALLAELDEHQLVAVRDREQAGKSRFTVLYRIDGELDKRRAAHDPIPDYESLRAAEILPLLAELDEHQLVAVRDREQAGRNRFTVLGRIDHELQQRHGSRDDPIPDYENLRALDILGRLDELDDSQLEQVRSRELAGARRPMIIDRVDRLRGEAPPRSDSPVASARRTENTGTQSAPIVVPKEATRARSDQVIPPGTQLPQRVDQAPVKIFICYRRDDSEGHAGRLYDSLVPYYGEDAVFMDIDRVRPGDDFVAVIDDAIAACDVMLVIIGRQWLNAVDDKGRRRLDQHRDWVRLEVAAALKNRTRMIPVLVQRADMPSEEDLPESIAPLARRQAFSISSHWRADVRSLIRVIDDAAGVTKEE